MKLTLVRNQALSSELKQISDNLKTDADIIEYINLGLVALYTRYVLKTEEAILTLQDAKSIYTLDGTDPDVTVAGLPMDPDDVLSLLQAYEEDGTPTSINDSNDPLSIFTVSYNQIQVPLYDPSDPNSYISIIYKKNPVMLDSSTLCDATTGALLPAAVDTELDLPLVLLDPLVKYIGYRAHAAVHGEVQGENNTHFMRFVASCDDIDKRGVLAYHDVANRDTQSKGFV